jgi:hypothetical protein
MEPGRERIIDAEVPLIRNQPGQTVVCAPPAGERTQKRSFRDRSPSGEYSDRDCPILRDPLNGRSKGLRAGWWLVPR